MNQMYVEIKYLNSASLTLLLPRVHKKYNMHTHIQKYRMSYDTSVINKIFNPLKVLFYFENVHLRAYLFLSCEE